MTELVTIALLEFNSIAAGIQSADVMVKKAPITLLQVTPVCPGKFIILIYGDVSSVDSSLKEGIEGREIYLVDKLFLPNAHSYLIPAITGTTVIKEIKSLAVIETFSVASCIIAADAACKAAQVELIIMRLACGLGGKAYFTMTGELPDIEASYDAALKSIAENGLLVNGVIIPSPHIELNEKML